MMQPVVLYQRTAYEAPEEVKMLLFQDALHLYHPETNAFLLSIPVKYITELVEKEETVIIRFRHSDDVAIILEDDHPLLPDIRGTQKRKLKPGAKVALLTLVVIGGILLFNVLLGMLVADVGLRLITPEYEKQLGEQMHNSTVPQTLVDERRTAIMQNFANQLQLSEVYPVKITVLRSREVNAYAIPGGHIVVYTGLLNQMQHYEELVALLGHEVSHINQRHTTRTILKSLSTRLFLILFMDVSQVGGILLLNADRLRSLSYSRSLEQEADEEGLKIMQRNNVDVNGMLDMFNRLKTADTTDVPSFLNTHPLTDKRIRYTKAHIADMKQTNAVQNPVLQELWINLQRKEPEPVPRSSDEIPVE